MDKIKDYTISSFNNSILELANINKNEKTCNNIYNGIYKFVNKIYKKYQIPFSIKFWNQLEKSERSEIYEISLTIINDILNFNGGIDLNLEDLDNNIIEEDLNYNEIDKSNEKNENIINDNISCVNLFEDRELNKKMALVKNDDYDFYNLNNNDSRSEDDDILSLIVKRKSKKR